jgi:hypothetical protein
VSDYRDLRNRDFAEQRRREGEELEEQAREFERAKRQRQREERRGRHDVVDELRAEIEAVRADVAARHECIIGAAGEALGQTQAEILNHVDGAIKKVQTELFDLVARKFGELIGRIEAMAPVERGRNFKFANEPDARDDDAPLELPNPLPRRGLN